MANRTRFWLHDHSNPAHRKDLADGQWFYSYDTTPGFGAVVGPFATEGEAREDAQRKGRVELQAVQGTSRAAIIGLPHGCQAHVHYDPEADGDPAPWLLTTQSFGGPGSRRHTRCATLNEAIRHGLRWGRRKQGEARAGKVRCWGQEHALVDTRKEA